jgi:hypothetical protein
MNRGRFTRTLIALAVLALPAAAEAPGAVAPPVAPVFAAPGLSLIEGARAASRLGPNLLRVQATCPRCVRWDAQGNCVEWRACRAPTGVRG